MSDIDQLREILCEATEDSTNSAIPLLIQIIDDALGNGKRRYDMSKQTSDQSSELTSLLTRLANREIQSNNTLLSFGSGSQLGDITIRDIIGGSKFTINIGLELNKPKVQKIEEKRVFGCLGISIFSISTSRIITTLILIVAITMISIFIRQITKNPLLPTRPTSLAIEPTSTFGHPQAMLRITLLNYNESPDCILIHFIGIDTTGWKVYIDGTSIKGDFNEKGEARICNITIPEFTFSVRNEKGKPVSGALGVPATGGAKFEAHWR